MGLCAFKLHYTPTQHNQMQSTVGGSATPYMFAPIPLVQGHTNTKSITKNKYDNYLNIPINKMCIKNKVK